MFTWLKDKLAGSRTAPSAAEPEGGEVSEGPNSFGGETAVGGADSTFGTPDATPSVALGDRDNPPAPGAS